MTKFEKQMVAKLLAAALVISGIAGINQTVSVKAEENVNTTETTVNNENATPDNAMDVSKGEDNKESQTIVSGAYTYHDDGNGNAVIDSYTGTDKDVSIPEKLDGKTVTVIGENAFAENDEITSVAVPNTVTSIQYRAFYLTKNLHEVTFQDGSQLKALDDQVFYESELSKIEIPENVEKIGKYAFAVSAVNNIVLPDRLTEIAEGLFDGCSQLETVKIQNGVKTIGTYAFCGCATLQDINIPDSVAVIKYMALSYCGFKNIQLPSNLVTIENRAFMFCENLESIDIPDSVTELGRGAFQECSSLKSVKLGKGLKETGDEVFRDTPVENVDISNQIEIVNYFAFANTNIKKLSIPDSVTEIQYKGFYTDTLEEIKFSKNLKKLSSFAFSTNSKWYLNQPEGVVYAGPVAYKYKDQMPENQTITIKEGTTAIAEAAFLNSTVKTVTLPDTMTYIGEAALVNCKNLMEVEIPYGVQTIDKYAFGYEVLDHSNSYVADYDSDDIRVGIERGKFTVNKIAGFTIKGYAGTAAEAYAKENGFTFVNIAPSSIKLSQTTATMHKNETLQLQADVAPEIAKNAKLSWSTSNPAVATVSESGLVTANGDGTAKITVKTINGISATCEITVSGTRTSVTISGMEGSKACIDMDNGFGAVPDAIKDIYATVDDMTTALKNAAISANDSLKSDKASVKLMDVVLKIQAEDGSWKAVDDSNFPKEGVTIMLPYPEGTDKDNFDFTVAHMLTSGKNRGNVEILDSEKTADGLQVIVHSLSPIAIVYQQSEKISDQNPEKKDDITTNPANSDQTKPETKPNAKQPGKDNVSNVNTNGQTNTNNQSATTNTKKAPITGDAQNVISWLLLLGGAMAIVVVSRKYKKRA